MQSIYTKVANKKQAWPPTSFHSFYNPHLSPTRHMAMLSTKAWSSVTCKIPLIREIIAQQLFPSQANESSTIDFRNLVCHNKTNVEQIQWTGGKKNGSLLCTHINRGKTRWKTFYNVKCDIWTNAMQRLCAIKLK